MRFIPELYHFSQVMSLLLGRWFEVASWLCLHTMWPSCQHVQCSQLTGLTVPCGHDFCSVAFFFLSPYLLCLNVRLSGGKQGLQAASLQSRFIFGMTRFPLKIERLIYWAFSSHDCTIWILWCLIKVPLHNTAAFITSNSNVSYSAGVLRVSVLLLSKWRGESLELQKTVSVYEFNQIVNVSWYMILIKVHMDFRD